jgi:hypothetical protein
VLRDSPIKVDNQVLMLGEISMVVILTYLAFSSASNKNMKYPQFFVSHLNKTLVSLVRCLFLLLVLNDDCDDCSR